MVDKSKFNKFLKSDYRSEIKIFVSNYLEKMYITNLHVFHAVPFLFDLDIFDEDIKPSAEYHVIDFYYLNSLEKDVCNHFLKVLSKINRVISDDYAKTITFLIDTGILWNNVEYLKIKRERKLSKINDGGYFDDNGYYDDDNDNYVPF